MRARPLSDLEMVMIAVASCLCTLVLTKFSLLAGWFLELAGGACGVIVGVYLAKANDQPKASKYLSVMFISGGILVIALVLAEMMFGWI